VSDTTMTSIAAIVWTERKTRLRQAQPDSF